MKERQVFVHDEFTPEDSAMLAALYSRSPASVLKHLEKVREVGSGAFVEKYLVGYGHQSIGDCGSTTFYLENISMLAAKAVQDWPLYSGQEASTRYIDFSKQEFIDPTNSAAGKEIQEEWRTLYLVVLDHLKNTLQLPEGTDLSKYSEAAKKRAINARAFDIARGLLPAGASTMVAWHTNLRQAADKLSMLVHHPLKEVRDLGAEVLQAAKKKYPHSFGHERSEEVEAYNKRVCEEMTYHDLSDLAIEWRDYVLEFALFALQPLDLEEFAQLAKTRPRGALLPRVFEELGPISLLLDIDFGSYRDFQRHRHGYHAMPILRMDEFHPWYLDQLPGRLQDRIEITCESQKVRIKALNLTEEEEQYFIPMGYKVKCMYTATLPSLVYLLELRSSIYVHPTLRKPIKAAAMELQKRFPVLKLHTDERPGEWDAGRGNQTIEER